MWNAAVAKQTAYASAVTVDIGGRRQIVAVAADRVFAVDPANGRVLWQAPGPGGTIEVSNSVLPLSGGRLLLSNWEESILIEVTPAGGTFTTREVWRTNRLRNANGPTLHRNGFLYGFAGGFLVCMNADTQEIRWRERTGAATLIGVGDEVVLLGQDSGELQVATVTPEAFTARRRVRPFASEARAVTGPSYAGGRLYVRNLTEIAALRLR